MRINTFFYSIKQGFKNIFRNKMFSLASIATMAACIFMFGLFYIVVTNFSSMVKTAEEGVAVTVFFNEGTTEDVIKADKAQIEKRAEVGKVDYQSAADAWSDYQKEYFEGYDDAAASFGDDNPLSNSANLQVYLNDVSMQQTLVNYIKGLEGVRKVNQSQDVANTLTDLNKLISYVSGGIHSDSSVCCDFPYKQHSYYRYCGQTRGNSYHEAYRSDGFSGQVSVCGRRYSHWTDRISDSSGIA